MLDIWSPIVANLLFFVVSIKACFLALKVGCGDITCMTRNFAGYDGVKSMFSLIISYVSISEFFRVLPFLIAFLMCEQWRSDIHAWLLMLMTLIVYVR